MHEHQVNQKSLEREAIRRAALDIRGRKKSLTVALATGMSLTLLVACGNAGSTNTSNAGTGNGTTVTSKTVTALSQSQLSNIKQVVSQAEAVPTFTAPGPKVSAASAKGDKALVFPSSSEISYCSSESSDLVSLGNQLGINITNFSTTGQPTQWVQGALQAISSHDNAFAFTCGIPANALTPQLLKAKQQNVGTILDQQYDTTQPAPSSVTAATGIPLEQAERLMVDDAILQNNGKPFHALILTANDLVSGPAAAAAVKAEYQKEFGTTAGITLVNVPVADWSTRVQSAVSSALQNDPSIDAVFACFDGMVPTALPAVEAKKNPNLKIYTYGAGAGVVKLIQSTNGVVTADVGANAQWAAYVLMDELLRVMNHQTPAPPNKDYPPLRMWTPDNVSQFFAQDGGYGSSYISGFKDLWGINS